MPGTSGFNCNSPSGINPIHKNNNKYNNPICDITVLQAGDTESGTLPVINSITSENSQYCHLRIPIDHIPRRNDNPLMTIPDSDKVIRHGGNSSDSGPPCDSSNQIAQDYINAGKSYPSQRHITNDKTSSDRYSRYVDTHGTRHVRGDGPNATPLNTTGDIANDWRDIYEVMYDTCYQNNGSCYMDNAICQTSNKTPLPLVDLQAPSPVLTIPTASITGCRNITKVDICSINATTGQPGSPGTSCNAIDIDNEGNIIDKPGECRYARWNNGQWNILQGITNRLDTDDIRCFPSPDSYNGNTISHPDKVLYDSSIFDNHNKFENMCKKVRRFPASTPTPTPMIIKYRIKRGNPCRNVAIPPQDTQRHNDINQVTDVHSSADIRIGPNNILNQVTVTADKYWDSWSPHVDVTPPSSDISYQGPFNSIRLGN